MIGSLATGYGGLDLGLEAVVGGELAWCAEYDPHATRILTARYPAVPNLGDVTRIDWTRLERVEWLTAGYPCQPFSHAGNRRGEDDDRNLWPHIAAGIRVLRPGRVLLENVRGHLSLGFGRVLGDLADLGYDTRWVGLRAADVGAPHGRFRIFILATDTAKVGCEGFRLAGRMGSELTRAVRDECAPPHTEDDRRERGGAAWGRRAGPADHRVAAADADVDGFESVGRREPIRCDSHGRGGADTTWGQYESAIRRWEHILGRPAPPPTEPGRTGQRLSPVFVEWLMGLPPGWVTGVPIPRNAQLKALGNGVVPQQAAAAVTWLLEQEAS